MKSSTIANPPGCVLPDRTIVTRLRKHVQKQTDESLNDRFGISYNTWRRLISGRPVRASLLSRLEMRLDLIEQRSIDMKMDS